MIARLWRALWEAASSFTVSVAPPAPSQPVQLSGTREGVTIVSITVKP